MKNDLAVMENNVLVATKGNFSFSTVKMENLGASEYTLVTIALDKSGSVGGFKSDLLKAVKSAVSSCKKSQRAENLLLRVVEFNNDINEVHGFKLLNMIDVDKDYIEPVCDGMTALNDAVFSSVGSTLVYAKKLMDQEFNVNGICFVITDGVENASKTTTKMITDMMKKAQIGEEIESFISILVGINVRDCAKELEDFKNDVGMNKFVDVGDATPQRLAKFAEFVSKSISSHSLSLQNGTVSKPITF